MRRLLLFLYLTDVIAVPSIINTSIACDKSDFLLKLTFNDTFHGAVFTQKGDPNCVYVNGTVQADSHYQIKIPLVGCETSENPDGNYENEIIVQNGNFFDSSIDKKFLLTCIPSSPVLKDSQVTVSFGGVTIAADATTASTLTNQSGTVDYTVRVLDGDTIDSKPLLRPLAVGDRVTYLVEMGPGNKGRIGRCWAKDGKSELPLSDAQGCSLQRAGEVWGDFEVTKTGEKTLFINHIKAWAFPTSNEVNIFCNLHVCATCEQPTCRSRLRRMHVRMGEPHPEESNTSIDPFSTPIDISDIAPPIPIVASFRLKRTPRIETSDPPAQFDSLMNSAERLRIFFIFLLILGHFFFNF